MIFKKIILCQIIPLYTMFATTKNIYEGMTPNSHPLPFTFITISIQGIKTTSAVYS